MTLSRDEDAHSVHPYSYARVLGVFDADVRYNGGKTLRVEFLWVRWFEVDATYPAGWNARRLDRISFVHSDSPDAFGFLDPSDVLRASHIIPAFAHGMTDTLLPPSIARSAYWDDDDYPDHDWMYYYVNRYVSFDSFVLLLFYLYLFIRFVDRDMFVRYLGYGIGHKSTNEFTRGMRPMYYGDYDINEEDIEVNDEVPITEEQAAVMEQSEEEYDNEHEEQEEDGRVEEEDEGFEGEDGEEPWDMGDEEAVGYAEF